MLFKQMGYKADETVYQLPPGNNLQSLIGSPRFCLDSSLPRQYEKHVVYGDLFMT